MVVDDVAELSPGPGQVLVETIACGICGSDLHTVDHAHELAQVAADAGSPVFDFDPAEDLVMGHEVSVRVLDTGAGVDGVAVGAAMAAMPALTTEHGRVIPGYDNTYPGGYCERMLLDPAGLVPVPNGLDPAVAALTEPMAVGLNAVNRSSVEPGRPAIVIGAGPVGLSVIAALTLAGIEPIVAADLSPRRRGLAAELGAHVIVDPGTASTRQEGFDAVVQAWAEHGPGDVPPVVFEAVGVPGMIDMAMAGAPAGSELLVVGVCMEHDRFRPMMGIMKNLTIRFVLGWTAEEFTTSLHNLAGGLIDGSKLITGHVELDEVPEAFAQLAHPDQHVKVLVRPNGVG